MTSGALIGIGDVSRERFVELFIELGRTTGTLRKPRFDADAFTVVDGGTVHDLATVYDRFLAVPHGQRRQFLQRVLRGANKTPPERMPRYEEVAPKLLPRLRTSLDLDLIELDARNRGSVVACAERSLVDELHLTVVIHDQDRMLPVSTAMLEAWDLRLADVERDAMVNLTAISTQSFDPLSPGLWMGPWDDAYAASRALLDQARTLCAQPVVAVPNRDAVIVADGTREAAVVAMTSIVDDMADREFVLTPRLFTVTDESWQPWAFPEGHPARARHDRVCRATRVRAYGKQQWSLQRAVGDELYVATAELDESRDGTTTTRALWTEGAEALLPDVDRLHLLSAAPDGTSNRLMVVGMADMLELDGVLARTELRLPRYRTLRFPHDAEIEAVGVPVANDPETASLSDPGRRP